MNDSSHFFVLLDEDARCIECDARPGGSAASRPCEVPVLSERPWRPECKHPSIARCEQTIPWCTDCHAYIDTTTRRASIAPTLAECVELSYDRDSGRFQYPEDCF